MITETTIKNIVEVNGTEYKVGDFVTVEGHGPVNHKRVIRIDKIVQPHLSFVCEYDNENPIFFINAVFINGLASIEEIEKEMNFREGITSYFGKTPYFISFEWGTINDFNRISDQTEAIYNCELFIYEQDNKYTISLVKDDPWHDGAMASDLNISYLNYISILSKFNGKQIPNLIEYAEDDLHHSTDTWFDNLDDCKNCIKHLKKMMSLNQKQKMK